MTESHLYDNILNAEINIEGYNIFRGDRTFTLDRSKIGTEISEGGGSIVFIRDNLCATVISSFIAPDSLAIKVNTPSGDIVIVTVYRSTSLNNMQDNLLLAALKQLCSVNTTIETLIVGDFNLPDVCWVTGTVLGPVDSQNKNLLAQREYLNMVNDK